MPNLLLMEGNVASKRKLGGELGVCSASEIYALAIRAHFPDLELDVDQGLAWQLGIDEDNTDHRRRRLEIINWVETRIL